MAAGRFFALEVTVDVRTFMQTNRANWTPETAYATWQDGPLLADDHVTLPARVWNSLRAADRLFYRVLTSSRSDRWQDVAASPPQGSAQHSSFTAIVDSLAGLVAPDLLVLSRLVFPPADVTFDSGDTVVQVRYAEQTPEPFQRVTVLPDGITLSIEDVF